MNSTVQSRGEERICFLLGVGSRRTIHPVRPDLEIFQSQKVGIHVKYSDFIYW